MSGFTLPVSRTSGRSIVVGSAASRALPLSVLGQLGYQSLEVDDPYAAMSELCQRPLAYRALAVCLGGLYHEELQMIATVKRRFAHVEIWLAQVDGRAAALAEASRLGADGLVSEDGLHRFTPGSRVVQQAVEPMAAESLPQQSNQSPQLVAAKAAVALREDRLSTEFQHNDPVLTADELRALLQDQPSRPEVSEEGVG